MPYQCCHVITKLILGWFVGGKKPQTLMIPIHSTTVLYDYVSWKIDSKCNDFDSAFSKILITAVIIIEITMAHCT